MLEDLYDSLATDIEVADAETAKTLIKELEEKCENISKLTSSRSLGQFPAMIWL